MVVMKFGGTSVADRAAIERLMAIVRAERQAEAQREGGDPRGPIVVVSALVVTVSLVFWGWLWGPAGMFLSVPLTMVARILLEGGEKTRWIAQLLDSNPPPPAPSDVIVASAGGVHDRA